MSRAHRGAGRRPVHRTPVSRLLFSRDRRYVRARALMTVAGVALAAATLLAVPQPELQLTVMQAIRVEAPVLRIPHVTVALAEPLPAPPEPSFEIVDATVAGLDPSRLDEIVAAVTREVRRGRLPGAALVVGRGSRVVGKHGIGTTVPGGPGVDPDGTLYDLASLTKVVGTTAAVMLLVDDGAMELDAPVSRYLPEFSGAGKGRVTVRHLLTHTSGLPAGIVVAGSAPDAVLRRIIATPLKWRPGERMEYSDLGPIVLFAAAERAAGEPLEALLQRRIYQPLGMKDTGFSPPPLCDRCAPTTTEIHGRVHDPLAQRLGGVAGHAGLFSTGSDIARFAAMLAGGGELEGVRIFREETIAQFADRQPGAGTRALGWDTPDPRGRGAAGERLSVRAFGHTGFTGTSLWIDRERATWAVLLSNRTLLTSRTGGIQALRRAVNDLLSEAADFALTD